jgi:predicted RNA-binding protein with PUA-like domain
MNNLRAMRCGDRCLFYHSGAGAASRRVVGVVEVAREWYEGEEGEATAGGAVDVRAVGEFQKPVGLAEIKKAAGEVEGMKDFALIRQARLSVMPVPVKIWDWICEMGGGFVQDGEVEDETVG